MPPRIGPKKPRRVYLAQWREYVGWYSNTDLTQERLGDRFHPPVSKSTVSRWEKAAVESDEKGERKLTRGVIEAYAEALGRPVEDMYRPPPPIGEQDPPSLDHKAAEMGIDRVTVIKLMEVMTRKTG